MIPNQTRTVDPFSSYHSDNVNQLTRMVTQGGDKLLRDTYLFPTIDPSSDSILRISDGLFIKDDVLIHFYDDTTVEDYVTLAVTDPTNYVDGVVLSGTFPQYPYLVVDYQYAKQPSAPVAKLMILNDPNTFSEDYLFLGRLEFSNAITVTSIQLEDSTVIPTVTRQVANLSDPYTDLDSVIAFMNAVENTATVTWALVGGRIQATATTGVGANNVFTTWTGTPIVVNHGQDSFPVVQVMDNEPTSPYYKKIVAAIVNHASSNTFSVDFSGLQSQPYSVVIIY